MANRNQYTELLANLLKRAIPYFQKGWQNTCRVLRTSRWVPGAVISFLAGILIIIVVDWQALARYLDWFQWWKFIFVVFLLFNFSFCRALIHKSLLQAGITYSQSLGSVSAGQFIDMVLPMKLGDRGRAFLLGHKLQTDYFSLRGAVRVERFLDVFVIVLFVYLTLLVSGQLKWLTALLGIVFIFLLVMLFSLPLVHRFRDEVVVNVKRLLDTIAITKNKQREAIFSFLEGAKIFASWRNLVMPLFWTILAWTFRFVGMFIIIKVYQPQAVFGYGIFTAGVLALSSVIPCAPASVAVYEGAVMLALFLLGVDPTIAFACAITSHFIDLLPPLILGGAVIWQEGEPLSAWYEKLIMLQ